MEREMLRPETATMTKRAFHAFIRSVEIANFMWKDECIGNARCMYRMHTAYAVLLEHIRRRRIVHDHYHKVFGDTRQKMTKD